MNITGHRLRDAEYIKAHASGGAMVPTLIILHDTAGRVEKGSSVNWFKSEDCSTSAHVVIERDGTVTQMVDFNKRAFHAGASEWQGVSNCNAFSIGIEIVNPGKLDKDGRAWFHKKTEAGFTGVKRAKTAAHGDGWWLDYTPEQIEAVTNLCKALIARYPEIQDITTHWTVSPKRKIDTGPLFPLDAVRQEVFTVRGVEPEIASVQPAIQKPVIQAVQSSRTVFGTLIATIGATLAAAKEVVTEAASQIVSLAPAKEVLGGFGLTATRIAFIVTAAGLAYALYARLDDAHKGRNVK
jgi:N-acetylmuramoyl-L-alanine amidase